VEIQNVRPNRNSWRYLWRVQGIQEILWRSL